MRKQFLAIALALTMLHAPLPAQPIPDSAQVTRIYYTVKVWGFLKYFHNGNILRNWDDEFLTVMPNAKRAQTREAFDSVMTQLIADHGQMRPPAMALPYVEESLRYNLDLEWISDSIFTYQVAANMNTVRLWFRPQPNYYVGGFGYPTFEGDKIYYNSQDTLLPSENIRLLALARYWNIINYFFPYKNRLDRNWDSVLLEFIPKVQADSDNISYMKTMMELATRINDAQGILSSPLISNRIVGSYYLPLRLQYLGNETVVSKVLGGSSDIQSGDILRKVNGVDIHALRDSIRPFTVSSNEWSLERNINERILLGRQNESVQLSLDGSSGAKEVTLVRGLTRVVYDSLSLSRDSIWKKLRAADSVHVYGYVDMARLEVPRVGQMFTDLSNTDGIIFDCRNLPRMTLAEIARHLFTTPLFVAKFTIPNILYPGTMELKTSIVSENNLPVSYAGGVMILFNEETQGEAEYTVMGLEQHPRSLNIGSRTGGGIGQVTKVYLPGGIIAYFSSVGVTHPDGTPTQRDGIIPDVVVRPTIDGIRGGHDEVLEAALRQVLKTPDPAPPKDWTWKAPFPQWNDLRAVYSLDADTMYSVGDLGTIVKSTDGGTNWIRLNALTVTNLHGVWFTDVRSGYAVGDNGTVLRTTNGGSTWSLQVIDPALTFYGLCFTDINTGIIVGSSGAIYRTTDAGDTWIFQSSGPAVTYRGICFSDANNGVIVGSSGSIFRTTNGGRRWSRQVSGFEGTDTLLTAVSFPDALHGIIVGRSGVIMRTINGGSTWTLQPSGTAYHLNSVSFSCADTGMAVGDAGIILLTTDGGQSWTTSSTTLADWYSGISMTKAGTATAVGYGGAILHTTNNGYSWTLQTRGPRVSLHGVSFTDAITGTVVGDHGSIFRTTNGGATWATQPSGTESALRGIAFSDSSTAIIVGDNGTILRTSNGGSSWSDLTIRAVPGAMLSFTGVAFRNENAGTIVGRLDTLIAPQQSRVDAMILHTTDGGINWVRLANTLNVGLNAIAYSDVANGCVVGDNGLILMTIDGGTVWSNPEPAVTTTSMYGVSYLERLVATIVGDNGTIYHTTDAGKTWALQHSGTPERLNAVCFVNPNYGLAVGDSGAIFRTSDGGATWSARSSGTAKSLYAVSFSDINSGTAVGDAGTILRTEPGGIPVSVAQEGTSGMPTKFLLSQNFPNPFNPATVIRYRLAASGFVTLKIYDLLGREVVTLIDGSHRPGTYQATWNAAGFPSGVYFYRLQTRASSDSHAKEFIDTKKMLLVK